ANQNMLEGYEALGYFDPVSNDAAHRLLSTHFSVANGYFDLTPRPQREEGFSARELDVARFCGVTHVLGLPVADPTSVRRVGEELFELSVTLPRAFVLSEPAFAAANEAWKQRRFAEIVEIVRADLDTRSQPLATRLGVNELNITCDSLVEGRLVVLQAYSSGWSFESVDPERFCATYPAWRARLEPGRVHGVRYWPRGLSSAIVASICGAAMALAAIVVSLVLARRAVAQGDRLYSWCVLKR
ncbi:MAG: hypothetical protein ACT4TC_22485, partial [Myxococcaceae bacterium]